MSTIEGVVEKMSYAKRGMALLLVLLLCSVMVAPALAAPQKSIKLNKATLTMGKAMTYSLKATVRGATDSDIRWSSSDKKVAKVSQKGKVTALATGKTTITASLGNGIKAKCVVTVKKDNTLRDDRAKELGLIKKKAPAFSVTDIKGKKYSLSSLKGKVIVLNLFSTGCGACVSEMPGFQALSNTKNVIFIAVSMQDKSTVRNFAQANGYTFPMVSDPSATVWRAYSTSRYIPQTYVIDTKGIIRYAVTGGYGSNTASVFKEILKKVKSLDTIKPKEFEMDMQ